MLKKIKNIKNIRKIITLSILIVVLVSAYFRASNDLIVYGYTNKEVNKKINLMNVITVSKEEKEILLETKETLIKDIIELGVTKEDIKTTSDKLVDQNKELKLIKEERTTFLENEIEVLNNKILSYEITYESNTTKLFDQYQLLIKTLEDHLNTAIKLHTDYLLSQGYTAEQLAFSDLSLEDKYNKTLALNNEVKEKENAWNNNFPNADVQAQAMRMFNEINEYRASLGLAPYTYNYEQQACVYLESNAYASNKNPHNWLCKAAANENAGLSSINSDYVKIAMDFFKSDPPHEAVLSGNYNSATVAFSVQGNMVYMIVDVFY